MDWDWFWYVTGMIVGVLNTTVLYEAIFIPQLMERERRLRDDLLKPVRRGELLE